MKFDWQVLKRKPVLLGIGGAVLVALILIRNISADDAKNDADKSAPPVEVQIETVSLQPIEQNVTAAGKIRPVFETEISSTISAQIMDIRVEEGDEVEAGDTLVVLDRKRYAAAYERSLSEVRSAKAKLKQIKAEIERDRQLFDKKLLSLQDFEAKEASYELAISQMEQAEASEDQAGDDLSKSILLAPDGGVVTRLNKEIGEMALGSTFQADVLLIISDLSMMEVVVEVDETDVVDIEILDQVEIEIDAIQETVFNGRVSRVAHSASVLGQGTQEQSTNFEVIVTLNIREGAKRIDERIRPGMSATATIVTARHDDAVAVPIQALAARPPVVKKNPDDGDESQADEKRANERGPHDGGESHGKPGDRNFKKPEPVEVVFVVSIDSANSQSWLARLFGKEPLKNVAQREVELGISSDTHYEILSGLDAGEEIVVGNYRAVSKELRDGSRIKRKEIDRGEDRMRRGQ
ncbi:efflux RND transporter periplasmic adaptor subunit [Candidatus Neomarinimicrobiota bacterium]